jgi:predicted butyrate kinase (DUF1464 family)
VAYLLGGALSKQTIFSGGAYDIAPETDVPFKDWSNHTNAALRSAWLAWFESLIKSAYALAAVLPQPKEILLSGRMNAQPEIQSAFATALAGVAPVGSLMGLVARDGSRLKTKSAAQGAALIANGLAGGRYAELIEVMQLRRARGTVLDYLKLHDGDKIDV